MQNADEKLHGMNFFESVSASHGPARHGLLGACHRLVLHRLGCAVPARAKSVDILMSKAKGTAGAHR